MFPVPLTFLVDLQHLTDPVAREYLFHELADIGIRHIVLSDQMMSEIKKASGFEYAETLAKQVKGAGLDFVDAHAPFGPQLDLCCPDPMIRPLLLASHKLHIEICAMMGVDTLTIHVGNMYRYARPDKAHMEVQPFLDLTCEALAELLPLAEKRGVVVCIENIWSPNNQPEQLLYIKSQFPTDALGFCFDSGHANIMETKTDSPESNANGSWGLCGLPVQWQTGVVEAMLPHIVNCHLHDNNGLKDQHNPPGMGTVDWKRIVTQLRKAPRLKNIQCEVIPIRNCQPFTQVKAAFDRLAEL